MTSGKASSPPPTIDGYTFEKVLGSGGFADVFQYQQHRPQRTVAIKVMRRDMDSEEARRSFDIEADRMAQLSSHPYIVTIYTSGIADDGRPYLVMEYCPSSLGAKFRAGMGVTEVLTVAIQIAGAVEAVHRAGILHRDIKPANVLLTKYRKPALTDFGISAATHDHKEAEGLSIPWSPPEAFGTAGSTVASDVYSLAATVYGLLAGRTPFEIPGGDNSAPALVARIESATVPNLGRGDVPASLQQVFATAMDKNPAARYHSAEALARAWQQVQTELRMSVTPIEVPDDAVPDPPSTDDDEPLTRIRSIQSIDPVAPVVSPAPGPWQAPVLPGTSIDQVPDPNSATSGGGGARPGGSAFRGPVLPHPQPDPTVQRAPAQPAASEPDESQQQHQGGRGRKIAIAAGVGVLVIASVLGYLGLQGDPPADAGPSGPTVPRPVEAVSTSVPVPVDVAGRDVTDGVEFSWRNPDVQEGDRYLYRVVDPTDPQNFAVTEETTVVVETEASGATCLEVLTRRADGRASDVSTGCVEP